MWVDFHWHSRDEEQFVQETVARSLAVAEAVGLDAIAAMPNTTRPLITLERCRNYLSLADRVKSQVRFFVHIGLTPSLEQAKLAVDATRINKRIVGIKAYFGSSTGNLNITREEDQHRVFEVLAREDYAGVLVGHFEDESLMRDYLYDSNDPRSWSVFCRPEIVEVSCFRKILRMAEGVGFKGKLHVAHVSTCEVVDEILAYTGSVKLSCGVTPHHLFLDNSFLDGSDGCHYKCNPPLRDKKTQEGLLERFLSGKNLILESDHAPHTESSKRDLKPPSGISSGTAWPFVIDHLRSLGASEDLLFKTCFYNALSLYKVQVERGLSEPDFARLTVLQSGYAFDPFAHLKHQ